MFRVSITISGFNCRKAEVSSAAAALTTSSVIGSSTSRRKSAYVVLSVRAVRGPLTPSPSPTGNTFVITPDHLSSIRMLNDCCSTDGRFKLFRAGCPDAASRAAAIPV